MLLDCTWTNWIALGNCTPSCGSAYRIEIRSCIDLSTSQSCNGIYCGDGGIAVRNASCSTSPPCEGMYYLLFERIKT